METVATFRTYADARRAADHLAGRGFPAAGLAIVGSDLCLVRRCVGRRRWWRSLATGAVGGAAAAGLLVGAVLALVTARGVGGAVTLTWTAVCGAVVGAALAAFARATAGDPRCVFVRGRLTPREYDLQTDAEGVERARTLLTGTRPPAKLPGAR